MDSVVNACNHNAVPLPVTASNMHGRELGHSSRYEVNAGSVHDLCLLYKDMKMQYQIRVGQCHIIVRITMYFTVHIVIYCDRQCVCKPDCTILGITVTSQAVTYLSLPGENTMFSHSLPC